MRRAKLQKVVGMPNDIALYVAAQREGVPIHRWVKDAELLAQVASFDAAIAAKEPGVGLVAVPVAGRAKRTSLKAVESRGKEFALDKIEVPAGVLSEKHRRDAEQMATTVYPLLYAFENSAREFVDGHLTAAYGPDWWNEVKLVSKSVRDGVEVSRKAERENRTHSARNARPIYYTTFGDLVLIVQSEKGNKVFKPPLFPRATWFPELVKASEHTRNIVAHMNPLRKRDISRLEVNFEDWLSQIEGHLPPLNP
ncbi:MAG: Swt1 family HEPN domain-containing protein [Solirubrobacteraceae bacterium]